MLQLYQGKSHYTLDNYNCIGWLELEFYSHFTILFSSNHTTNGANRKKFFCHARKFHRPWAPKKIPGGNCPKAVGSLWFSTISLHENKFMGRRGGLFLMKRLFRQLLFWLSACRAGNYPNVGKHSARISETICKPYPNGWGNPVRQGRKTGSHRQTTTEPHFSFLVKNARERKHTLTGKMRIIVGPPIPNNGLWLLENN